MTPEPRDEGAGSQGPLSPAPPGWRLTTVGEFCTYYKGGTPFEKLEYAPNGIPVLAKGDIKPFGRLEHSGTRFVDPKLAQERHFYLTEPGDFLMTTRDLTQAGDVLGLIAPVPPEHRYLVNQGVNVVRFNDGIDWQFLIYWTNSPLYRAHMKANAVGSTQIHIRKDAFIDAPLLVPPPAEQQAIVGLLSSIDKKIDCNRRSIATIGQICRTLFASWFVTFDPVLAKINDESLLADSVMAIFPCSLEETAAGTVPKGWRWSSVGEVARLNAWSLAASDSLPTLRYVEISDVGSGVVERVTEYARTAAPSRARRRVRHGNTVLSTVRPDRRSYFLALEPPDELVVSTGFAVIEAVTVPWGYLHIALTSPDVFAHLGRVADGGAYPAVRPEAIAALPILIPDKEVAAAFDSIVEPMLRCSARLLAENETLAALRDTLLPKLMSAEVRLLTSSGA